MIRLLDHCHRARWTGAQRADETRLRDEVPLPWRGPGDDARGVVRIETVRLEHGRSVEALRSHPRRVGGGVVRGVLPRLRLPEAAGFEAEVGFVEGARPGDGARFSVWAHHGHQGRPSRSLVARLDKGYSGRLEPLRGDLAHLAGREVAFELRVDAGRRSDRDWAAWLEPRVVAPACGGAVPLQLRLDRFSRRDPDGTSDPPTSDPWLLALAVFADGGRVDPDGSGVAPVRVYAPARSHGNLGRTGVDVGDSFAVPDATGRFERELRPFPLAVPAAGPRSGRDAATVGIAVVVLDERGTPDAVARAVQRSLAEDARRELGALVRGALTDTETARRLGEGIRSGLHRWIGYGALRRRGLFDAADPDRWRGAAVRTWSYRQLQEAADRGLPFGMTFRRDGVRYVLDGWVGNG